MHFQLMIFQNQKIYAVKKLLSKALGSTDNRHGQGSSKALFHEYQGINEMV
jgi:hypothetical protein